MGSRPALLDLLAAAVLLLAALSACGGPKRMGFTEADSASAVIPGMPHVRYWLDDPHIPSMLDAPAAAAGDPVTVLALSGGADRGAYGAGFLNGWTKAGTRPEFTVVTGVSTGALIAPFAFLGPEFDSRLKAAYADIGPDDIYRLRFPLSIPFSVSAVSDKPLHRRIDTFITDSVIDRVAAAHRRGRRLYVLTVNIDAGRGVVWDMGAIAASGAPDRYRLFRQILLASSVIPAVFPPVAIETRGNSGPIEEWHVDGGIVAPLLAPPLMASGSAGRPVRLYVLVNERLGGQFDLVKPGIFSMAQHAFELSVQTTLRRQAAQAWSWSKRSGADYRLTYVAPDFKRQDDHDYFATDYMQALYAYGEERGKAGAWVSRPPPGGGPDDPAE